jgi:hypothetical protein
MSRGKAPTSLAQAACGLATSLALLGAPPAPASDCRQVPGLEPLLRPGLVLLVGEMHGTIESPSFLGQVVCHALDRAIEVVVGLEIPHHEQPALDAFLRSAGDAAAVHALLATEHWSREYQDGRSSQAMLELVRDLRRHVAGGAALRLVLFDLQTAERDAAMAARLAAAAESSPRAMVIALTGNLHARLARGSPWSTEFEPMGLFLRRHLTGREVLSLDVGYAGGSAWICTRADAAGCAARSLRGSDVGPPGVHLTAEASPHFSGRYSVGTLHASPPAAGASQGSTSSPAVPPGFYR